jgi:hypothetical protein
LFFIFPGHPGGKNGNMLLSGIDAAKASSAAFRPSQVSSSCKGEKRRKEAYVRP